MIRFGVLFHLFLLLSFVNTAKGGNSSSGAGVNKKKTVSTMSAYTTTVTPISTKGTVNTPTAIPETNKQTKPTCDTRNRNDSVKPNTSMLDLLLKTVQDPRAIIAFGIGVVLTTIIWALALLCCRCKRRKSLNLSDTLEMVSTQALKVNGPQDEVTQTHGEGVEDDGTPCRPEVEYSDIDFSALRERGVDKAKTRETAESEYAEIKREATETEPSQSEEHRGEQEEGGEEGQATEEILDTPTCEQKEEEIFSLLTEENNG